MVFVAGAICVTKFAKLQRRTSHPCSTRSQKMNATVWRHSMLIMLPEHRPTWISTEIADLAAQICDCPVSVVNVVAENWEWYKGQVRHSPTRQQRNRAGASAAPLSAVAMCLSFPNLAEDERFSDQGIVMGRPHYRFYAGAPLINPDGYALGTLCVLDYAPRKLEARQIEALRVLSRQVIMQLELRRKVAELEVTQRSLAEEKRKSDDLLAQYPPGGNIADELKSEGRVRPRYHESVTILFTDFKGFTQLTSGIEPRRLIDELNEHFSAFDEIVARHGLEKLKTIGDAYLCVAGLRERRQSHTIDACGAALEIRDHMASAEHNTRKDRPAPLGNQDWRPQRRRDRGRHRQG